MADGFIIREREREEDTECMVVVVDDIWALNSMSLSVGPSFKDGYSIMQKAKTSQCSSAQRKAYRWRTIVLVVACGEYPYND